MLDLIEAIKTINKHDISKAKIMYAIESIVSLSKKEFTDHKWLYNVKQYSSFKNSSEVLKEIISLVKNIVEVSAHDNLSNSDFNRIMSQLTNIGIIARNLDAKELSNLSYQFSKLLNEQLDPLYISSPGFSQEGEDLIVKRLFPVDMKGFYVDVGAHHPTRFSNTYLLYKQGWRGINIEPQPGVAEMFRSIRPGDINIEVAVGNGSVNSGYAKYVCFEEPAYNSVYYGNDEITNRMKSEIVDVRRIEVRSLDDILFDYSDEFTSINLLCIDVEGLEMQVLNGFSIEKYMPDIVVVEVRGFSIDAKDTFDEYKYFVSRSYRLRSVLFHSLIFERDIKAL